MKTLLQTQAIEIGADETSGAIVSFRLFGRELLGESPGHELSVNGQPLDLKATPATWTNIEPYPQVIVGDALNEMHGARFLTHYTGYAFDVTRSLRAVRSDEIHLTYTLQRTKIRTLYGTPGPGWGALEAPLRADGFTVPCWNWEFWGENTQMIALNTSNGGPSCHLGYENGPIEEVKATANHFFRRQYCGDMGFPGAIFYDPDSQNWLAVSCRRPRLAYQLDHQSAQSGVAFEFLPMCEIEMSRTIQLPEIVFHAGKTKAEMDEFLAKFLSTFYQEAPDWFGRTTWFDFSLGREFFSDWKQAETAALQLVENGAVSGLHLFPHQRNRAFGGTSPDGAGPLHDLGNPREFEAMVAKLKAKNVRLLFWMSTCGMTPGGDAEPDWFIRGTDGDTLCSWGLPHHPDIVYINTFHPGYRAYVEKWLHYYIGELGFDGVMFDCAGFAYPPDFAPREWMRFPSDTLLGNVAFFDWVMETVRKINPEAVVINEGNCLDAPCHGLLLGGNAPSKNDGMGQRDLLLDARNHGGKRFTIRASVEGDLAAGMINVSPWTNHGVAPDENEMASGGYSAIGADPYNLLLTKLVRENGAYGATRVEGGASILGRTLFVPNPTRENVPSAAFVPVRRGETDADGLRLRLPAPFQNATTLRELVTGERLEAQDGAFTFWQKGIWEIESDQTGR